MLSKRGHSDVVCGRPPMGVPLLCSTVIDISKCTEMKQSKTPANTLSPQKTIYTTPTLPKRHRLLNVRQEAFVSFLTAAEVSTETPQRIDAVTSSHCVEMSLSVSMTMSLP